MKSVLVEKEQPVKIKYPYLGISDKGRVVLFCKTSSGTLLRDTSETFTVTGVAGEWNEGYFKPLCGEITLSNE